MLRVTRDQKLTTAITGSYPRPLWYDVNLHGRWFQVRARRLAVPEDSQHQRPPAAGTPLMAAVLVT